MARFENQINFKNAKLFFEKKMLFSIAIFNSLTVKWLFSYVHHSVKLIKVINNCTLAKHKNMFNYKTKLIYYS